MRTALPLLLCLASPAFAGNVRVVGPVPAPYLTIQDAITASEDGDVILVKSGTYSSIRVNKKSISIIADGTAVVQATSAARISALLPSQTVLLAGIQCSGAYDPALPELGRGLSAVNNSGQILAQDCTFTGFTGLPGSCSNAKPPTGVQLQSSSGSFVGCTIRGGRHDLFWGDFPEQGDGIRVLSSGSIACDQTQIFGGQGGARCTTWDESGGGEGSFFDGNSTQGFFSGCSSAGGNGASIVPPCQMFAAPGMGGNGMTNFPSATVRLLASTFTGGISGDYMGTCWGGIGTQDPPNGLAIWGGATTLSGTVRTLRGPRVVRDSQSVTLTFVGAPGEVVELSVANDGVIHQYDASQSGVLHIAPSKPWRAIGSVPPGGTLYFNFKLPKLRPDNPGLTWFTQARFISAGGSKRLSNAWAFAEVDSTY